MQLNVSLDRAEIDRVLNALPRDIFRAQRSAERDTVRFARREMQNRMISRTGIPARVFRRFRVRTRNRADSGVVWVGLNQIQAAYLGKLQQSHAGAKAGAYFFERAFIATMKSGHKSLWRRLGQGRLPIEEMRADIDIGFEVAEDVAALAAIELRQRFADKVRVLIPHIE